MALRYNEKGRRFLHQGVQLQQRRLLCNSLRKRRAEKGSGPRVRLLHIDRAWRGYHVRPR